MSVEAIYQDRDQFASLVREVAAPDVGRMGIEILSFTIKDVYDNVEYLASLGRAQTANVKRDADIGVAEANRDAGIRVSDFFYSFFVNKISLYPNERFALNRKQEAECEKSRMDAKYDADTKIADASREYQMQKANYDMEVNAAVSCAVTSQLS